MTWWQERLDLKSHFFSNLSNVAQGLRALCLYESKQLMFWRQENGSFSRMANRYIFDNDLFYRYLQTKLGLYKLLYGYIADTRTHTYIVLYTVCVSTLLY